MPKTKQKKGSSVPLGSTLKKESLWLKIKNYINNKRYKFKLWSTEIIKQFMIKQKIILLISLLVNLIITGTLIYYVVNNRNLIAYGILVMLVTYYLDIIVQIIKKPYKDNK